MTWPRPPRQRPRGGDGSGTQDVQALYDFGYARFDRGASYLRVRPLARTLELAPDAGPVLGELVAALEADGQHARAVAVLEEHEPALGWLHRFQYVYNALTAGHLAKAAAGFERLPEPPTPRGSRRGRRCGGCSPGPTPPVP
jgi:hypothetical protein